MKLNKKLVTAAIGVATVVVVAGAASVAFAVAQNNGSDAALYMYDTNGVLQETAGHQWLWNDDALGSSSNTDLLAVTTCPAASTGVYLFLSSAGAERTPASWKASAVNGFSPGTKNVLTPNLAPEFLIGGVPGQGAIKAAGGTYSLGVACTTSNGNTVVGAFYRTITVAGTSGGGNGSYTVAAVDSVVGPPVVVPSTQTGTIDLNATTLDATNGVLSLIVPANAAATFGAPTLINNKSTTTGTLGQFTVRDGRVVTREGWTLSANVADFVNQSNNTITISKAQLGLVPQIVSSDSVGVSVGATQVAGAATYASTFAEGAASNSVGDTVLNAALTFVAPQNKPAGTYRSTMTLTVVSK